LYPNKDLDKQGVLKVLLFVANRLTLRQTGSLCWPPPRPNVPRQNDFVGLAFGTGGGSEVRASTPRTSLAQRSPIASTTAPDLRQGLFCIGERRDKMQRYGKDTNPKEESREVSYGGTA